MDIKRVYRLCTTKQYLSTEKHFKQTNSTRRSSAIEIKLTPLSGLIIVTEWCVPPLARKRYSNRF